MVSTTFTSVTPRATRSRCTMRSRAAASSGSATRASRFPRNDAELVVDVLDADDLLGESPRFALLRTAVHGARERDLAVLHLHLDLAGVEEGVVGQKVADVLADPLVRTSIVSWTAT